MREGHPQLLNLIVAFFGGVVLMLALQNGRFLASLQPQTSTTIIQTQTEGGVTNPPIAEPVPQPQPQSQAPAPPPLRVRAEVSTTGRCTSDTECPGASTICSDSGRCVPLRDAVCQCTQPSVLRCMDSRERSKHTFCENGCRITPQGAQCL